ncbi:hypothetical protein QTO30_09750 [Yoonia sp. GPGPB17]|uniref:hypothetical protein n=1 Tax=Yoonia sp. GPGPB17 TaxID=3026147 RepID=UPI0030BFAFED
MTRLTLATAICLLPITVSAETQLERFEALSDKMNVVMIDMMANEIEQQGGDATALRALDGMVPPWTDEIRAAAGCILDTYIDETSASDVDDMLTEMDAMLPTLSSMTMTEATDNGVFDAMTPDGITDERMLEINGACGMMELQIEASKNSGFMEAMMAAGSTVPDNN